MFGCQSEKRFIFILLKTKYSLHLVVFGVVISNGDVLPPFIFPHDLRLNTEVYTKWPKEVVLLWIKWMAVENPTSGNRTLHHATQAGKLNVGCKKISANTSPLTSGHLTPQIAIPLTIMCGAWLKKRPTKLHTMPQMNWKQE